MNAQTAVDLCFTPATELRSRIAERAVSTEEVLETVIDRLHAVNPKLNAIIAERIEAARAEAGVADDTPEEERGALHGVAFTVKDLNETLDMPTTYGSRALAGFDSGFEAVVITRLRQAGGILIGKTNTPEFALRPTTENELFGPTYNPWNLDHTPGGSSGGAAAAAAAGIAPLHLGSDGGGSLRIPGSCCGVVGMKPSRGLLPWAPVAYEYWAGLATNGAMTRTVRDCALMLDVMAGPVAGEPYPGPRFETSFLAACDRDLGRLRIAFTAHPAHGKVDAEVKSTFLEAVTAFEELGHEVVEASPGLHGLYDAFVTIVAGNSAAVVKLLGEEALGSLEGSTLAAYSRGLEFTAADYCAAVNVTRNESARILQFWSEHDILLTPTLTLPPPRTGAMPSKPDLETRWREYLDWLAFTYPFNMTGQPAITVPCGWTRRRGLPVGLQIVGAMGADDKVLALAAAFEGVRPWAHRRPPLE